MRDGTVTLVQGARLASCRRLGQRWLGARGRTACQMGRRGRSDFKAALLVWQPLHGWRMDRPQGVWKMWTVRVRGVGHLQVINVRQEPSWRFYNPRAAEIPPLRDAHYYIPSAPWERLGTMGAAGPAVQTPSSQPRGGFLSLLYLERGNRGLGKGRPSVWLEADQASRMHAATHSNWFPEA